jgi:heme/copper-type cytochrome/quinol oxidase subunit 2
MELTNKKEMIIAAAAAVVIVVVIVAFIAVGKRGNVPSVVNNNSQATGSPASVSGSATSASTSAPVTRLPVPANVVVPDAGAQNVAQGIAVPQVEAAASPVGNNKYRSFNIIIQNGQFMPDTIAVNLGDVVNLNLSAVGANYDFTQPDYSLGVPVPAGGNVRKQFQANVSGKFVFYCSTCGGPAKGPVGYLIVTGQ